MSPQTITDLLGEDLDTYPLGEDLSGDLTAGYIPGHGITYQPQTVMGDPVAGPLEDQQLQIFRDTRPIATDELGLQGPFYMPERAIARRAAGRTFPLNENWGAGIDLGMVERVPEQDAMSPSPFSPGQLPAWHDGVAGPEVIAAPATVFYGASPDVGWEGY